MELRNRNVGGRGGGGDGRLSDVSLGPTIYTGERYSKMSERLKRQHKTPIDVTNKLLAPRLIGFGIALLMILIFFFYVQYQNAARRRNRSKIDD